MTHPPLCSRHLSLLLAPSRHILADLTGINFTRGLCSIAFYLLMVVALDATPLPKREARQQPMPVCGAIESPPFDDGTHAGRRMCPLPSPRQYSRKHQGIGFEFLDIESEACFVPDELYSLLDSIVDESAARVASTRRQSHDSVTLAEATEIGRITGDVLLSKGFVLWIPTQTVGDALVNRSKPGEPVRHIYDCDTGSLILMTVAQSLSLSPSLVEITLPSGNQHNYVRWKLLDGTTVDWDTNQRGQCISPANSPSWQGKAMSHDETISYAYRLRGIFWEYEKKEFQRALADYRESILRNPAHPYAYNELAWIIVSKRFDGREKLRDEAIAMAKRAVEIHPVPNNLDTLACAYAFSGDYTKAAETEKLALDGGANEHRGEFESRYEQFRSASPHDCTEAN